jgi:hypothetical protein
VFIGLRDLRALPLVAGALVLFVKPQLFLVLAPVVLVRLIRAKAWRLIAITAMILGLVATVTTLRYPESLGSFSRGATDRADAFSQYGTTWALAHLIAPDGWVPLAVGLVAVATLLTIAAVRRLPPDVSLAGIVAGAALLSIVVAPVDFGYDQVVLVLVVVLAVAMGRRPLEIALTWAVAACVPWFVYFTELAVGGQASDALSGVVPLLMAPLLWFVARSPSAMTSSSPAIASTPANAK